MVFAFSTELKFDAFLRKILKKLTPYLLSKGFLQNQNVIDNSVFRLMVLVANSLHQAILHAATMHAVLHSYEFNQTSDLTSREPTFDESLGSCRIRSLTPGTSGE